MAVHNVTAVSLGHVVGAGQLAGVCIKQSQDARIGEFSNTVDVVGTNLKLQS